MITGRALTDGEKRFSQRYNLIYNAVNGISYMCLGETVLILFAVQLECSDIVVAVLGGMIHVGFLLLPLGKWMTARVGAANSQADFWVCRNIAALLVAAAAPTALYWSRPLAVAMIVTGAFFFYGFRAAGVVMNQPLLGEICDPGELGSFISRSWAYFYAFGLVALLAISLVLKLSSSVWTLCFIIIAGSIFGFVSTGFMRRIRETGQIRDSAAQPFAGLIGPVWRNLFVRHQLIAGMVCNIGTVLTVPMSMLALKRGYHVPDTQALLYSLVQFGTAAAASRLLAVVADRLGGRRTALIGFIGYFFIALFWIVAPARFLWPLLIVPFFFCSFGPVIAVTGLQQYFLRTVEKSQQVVASMIIAVGTGVVSGLLGMGVCSLLLKIAGCWLGETGTLGYYRLYFTLVCVLLPLLGVFVYRLERDDENVSR
ncbi:MAG: MFS transporter [Lentisphaeria bacterium]|nr:MFS transporter [Lentisphaeria bacterium]